MAITAALLAGALLSAQAKSVTVFTNGTDAEAVLTFRVPSKAGTCSPPKHAGSSNRSLQPRAGYSHPVAAEQSFCWLWSDRVVSWNPTTWCLARAGDAIVLGTPQANTCLARRPAK